MRRSTNSAVTQYWISYINYNNLQNKIHRKGKNSDNEEYFWCTRNYNIRDTRSLVSWLHTLADPGTGSHPQQTKSWGWSVVMALRSSLHRTRGRSISQILNFWHRVRYENEQKAFSFTGLCPADGCTHRPHYMLVLATVRRIPFGKSWIRPVTYFTAILIRTTQCNN